MRQLSNALAAFATELYEEHLEEASFLYEQRLTLLQEPDFSWLDLAHLEQRSETHLDALMAGGEHALQACLDRVQEGDAGERHAAVAIFCRSGRRDLLEQILTEADWTNEEDGHALGDALALYCSETWFPNLVEYTGERPDLIPIMLRLMGWRRQKKFREMLDSHRQDHPGLCAWVEARVSSGRPPPWLYELFRNKPSSPLRRRAANSLLWLGDQRVLDCIRQMTTLHDWAFISLALGGTREDAKFLANRLQENQSTPESLLALGLMGDRSTAEVLIDHLEDDALAGQAALALDLFTGAGLREEVFIHEEPDEDELFDEEKQTRARGETLSREDGTPYGFLMVRRTRKAATWRAWWAENQCLFQEGVRYRGGQPYSPHTLISNLEAPDCPNAIRAIIAQEFTIRYGARIAFEIDMPVARQREAINQLRQWSLENARNCPEGVWTFHGQQI